MQLTYPNPFLIPTLTALLTCASGCGDDDSDSPKTPAGCNAAIAPSNDDVKGLKTGLVNLKAGQTLCLRAGTYHFDKLITFSGIAEVTLKGIGATRDDVVLDFLGQTSGKEALSVTADGFTVENLTIKDAWGDGIKIFQSKRPTFRNVRAYYTTPDPKTHGAYALYPAECTDVLVEDCDVEGSSDAAIYIGQSTRGIVRNNKAHGSVIGIEVENSEDIEVYGNEAWGNTTGILVVNLPDLPRKQDVRISVHDNHSHENDHENFGDGFAAGLPRGQGMLVMGSRDVEVSKNRFENNSGPALSVVSWITFGTLGGVNTTDKEFEQFSERVYVHGNTFSGNGNNPQDVYKDVLAFTKVEDILWDGVVNDQAPIAASERRLCIKNNGAATFRNINIPGGLKDQTTDLAPHNCEYPTLPSIQLQSQ
jgi:parallel beta-helix repeat protein